MPPTFVPGLELSARFYRDAVRPLLTRNFPGLPHTAALLGAGSEVLGFDTIRSTDHDWGPRLQLFLSAEDVTEYGDAVNDVLARHLPATIAGYPTGFVGFPDDSAVRMQETTGPVRHAVTVTDLGGWLTGQLGYDPLAGTTVADWLTAPTQVLAEVTAGAVFHDETGRLTAVRRELAWYPDDVWRYVLACQWQRVGQEDHLPGRCAEVGDELGSAVVTARLARDLMRLSLLMSRVYPPYGKWLGSAFARLSCARELTPALTSAIAATNWPDRERHLVTAFETVADLHNGLGLTEPIDPRTRPFHNRPFPVLGTGRFSRALVGGIQDPALRELRLTGSVDQLVDNVDALRTPAVRRGLVDSVSQDT